MRSTTVKQDHQVATSGGLALLHDARAGTLPAVVVGRPERAHSEHPPAHIPAGQAYVTRGQRGDAQPRLGSTAIFLAWDDWGGFYDHVVPPKVDGNGYGLRVPGS